MKILVADDDLDLLGLVAYSLSQAGYLVLKASDGHAAIATFDAESPDLVIRPFRNPADGHYHLFVADLHKSFHFYHDILGFDNMGLAAQMGAGMVSAGNYHHHIGFNTWQGQGVPPQPADALGMRYLTFVLPSPNDLETFLTQVQNAGIEISQHAEGWLVRDPDDINFVFTAKSS